MNVLLVVLDCLRLDTWRKKMPQTKRLVRDWWRLGNHWGVAHCSDPNHAALFTGYGPWQTNVTTQMGRWDGKLPTIFWKWKKLVGGTTWAVQPLLAPDFYKQWINLNAWHKTVESADLELRAVKQFLSECEPGKPWLGFMRDMTLHYPYLDQPMPPRGSGGDIVPLYEQAALHSDQFFTNLVELVLSDYPDTIIAVCSDHGEMLGERYGKHGPQWDHLWTLHNVLVRIPMAMYVPGTKGKHTTSPTQHIDLLPTLCDLLGWERQGEGESWADWINGKAKYPASDRRALHLQGTGAGAVSEGQLEGQGSNTIDPRMTEHALWRHRGVVQGRVKLVENIGLDGARDVITADARDYREARPGCVNGKTKERLYTSLPPVPDYQKWEQSIIDQAAALEAERNDRIIFQRLQSLGYVGV